MFVETYNALSERLNALRAGRPPPLGVIERAVRLFAKPKSFERLESLRQLDEELERAGIHTSADARLLRDLSVTRGRVGALHEGLLSRAKQALGEFTEALSLAEKEAFEEPLPPARREALLDDFRRLSRVVKVAAIFSGARGAPELFSTPRASVAGAPQSARLVVAEFFVTRAQQEVADTSRKRRDLDLAYELVLRMGAETKGDRERVRQLRLQLGAARERVRSAPVVRSFDELTRHLRHAARVSPNTAWRSLRALYERAAEAGDLQLAELANAAALSLTDPAQLGAAIERAEALRGAGWRDTPWDAETVKSGGKKGLDDAMASKLTEFAFDLSEAEQSALELAAGCARFFDIEDALAEDFVEAETEVTRPIRRRVPYPTQLMSYETTNSLDHLPHFVLDRPGSVVLDLAAGRQLIRSYVEEEQPKKPVHARQGAVRVYVLDASGSMHGARARFRDALLISELNAIRVKAAAGRAFDPLYFTFFNDTPRELMRVDSGDEAARRIRELFASSPAEGQTDISFALLSAFDAIGRARGTDPYLARATVVLVTDGEDGVDLELIRKTRKPYAGLDISLSFISLGEENADLRTLVLEQRDEGGRAFYSHLSDAEIALARTDFDTAWRTLLPADVTVTSGALEKLLPHLEALEQIAQSRPPSRPQIPNVSFDALFPETSSAGVAPPRQLARFRDIVGAVLETSTLAPLDNRRDEAVVLLTHLLNVYDIPLRAWLEGVRAPDEVMHNAIARLRLVC